MNPRKMIITITITMILEEAEVENNRKDSLNFLVDFPACQNLDPDLNP